MFCFFPIILDLNDNAEKMGGYYLVMIPLLFAMYSVAAVPIRLPKQMFLCPLTREERKKYVSMLFWVRLIGTMIPGIFAYSVATGLGWIKKEFLPIQVFGLFTTLFCVSITSWPGSTWERDDKKKTRLKNPELKGLYPISVTGVIMAAILQVLDPFGLFEDAVIEIFNTRSVIFLGIYCGILLLIVVSLIRYIKPVLDMTIQYEYSYDVVNKEPVKA